jgi:hypothetical protein
MIKIMYQNVVVGASPLTLAQITFMFNIVYFVATGYYMMFFISNMMFNKIFYKEFFLVTGLSRFGVAQRAVQDTSMSMQGNVQSNMRTTAFTGR